MPTLLGMQMGASRILAQNEAQDTLDDFWGSGLGSSLSALLALVGVLVLIFGAIQLVGLVTKQKVGQAVVGLVGLLVVVSILFQPQLLTDAVGAVGNVVGNLVELVGDIVENNDGEEGQ